MSLSIDTLILFAVPIGLSSFTLFYLVLIGYPHIYWRMTMAHSLEPAMTVREVAKFLNVGSNTVYRLVQLGELPGFKVAGAWRFQLADMQRWIDERKGRPAKKKRSIVMKKRSGNDR